MSTLQEHFTRIVLPIDFQPAGDAAIESGHALIVGEQEVEFSAASARAVELASALARSGNGQLVMVHATPSMPYNSMYTGPISVPSAMIDEIDDRAKKASLEVLERIKAQYCTGLDVAFVVRPGNATSIVLDEAHRIGADLIVMAASGRSRVARFFVGSTADRVIREARCPVLVVPAA